MKSLRFSRDCEWLRNVTGQTVRPTASEEAEESASTVSDESQPFDVVFVVFFRLTNGVVLAHFASSNN